MKCITCGDKGYILSVENHLRQLCACRQSLEPIVQEGAVRSDAKVRILPVISTLDLSAERVLAAATDAGLKLCIVVGEEADGTLYFASTKADGPEVLWALERAKLALLKAGGAA